MKPAHTLRLVDPAPAPAPETRDYRSVLEARGYRRVIIERTPKGRGDLELTGDGRMVEHG